MKRYKTTITRTAAVLMMGGAAIAFGCTKTPRVEDAKTARASPQERQKILKAEQEVDKARTAYAASEAALREAREYQAIVAEELSAAESQVEAARRNVELVRGTEEAPERQFPEEAPGAQGPEAQAPEPEKVTEAEQAKQAAQLQLEAAQAKEKYAGALVELREKEKDAAEAGVAHKESLVEIAKYDVAEKSGTAEDLNRDQFVEAEVRAREEHEMKQLQVKQAQGRVDDAQKDWQKARERVQQSAEAPPVSDAPPPDEPDPGLE